MTYKATKSLEVENFDKHNEMVPPKWTMGTDGSSEGAEEPDTCLTKEI